MILLSIIIPVFNGEGFLDKVVDSIETLNYNISEEIEIILVNDGSTDKSKVICNELSERYKNISFYNKPNGGIAETRNYGLTKSNGKFFTFCDQDDLITKSYESFIKSIDKTDSDLLISNYSIDRDGKIINKRIIENDCLCDGVTPKLMIKRLLNITPFLGEESYNHIPKFYPSIWNCIFRKEVIEKHGIEISRFVNFEDDWKLLFDVLLVAKKVYLSEDSYYRWSVRSDSESHTRKVIEDYIIRRFNFREWYIEKLKLLYLDKKEKDCALLLFDRDTIYGSFYNYNIMPFNKYYYWMNKINYPFSRIISMKSFSKGMHYYVFLFLFSFHLWSFAYLVNKILEKKKSFFRVMLLK